MREKSIATEKIIKLLKILVAQSGYNYKQLSERSGLSKNTVTAWFSSTPPKKIKPTTLRKICRALDIEENIFSEETFNEKEYLEGRIAMHFYSKEEIINGKKWEKTNGGEIVIGRDNLIEILRGTKRFLDYLSIVDECKKSSNPEEAFSKLKLENIPYFKESSLYSEKDYKFLKEFIIEEWRKEKYEYDIK